MRIFFALLSLLFAASSLKAGGEPQSYSGSFVSTTGNVFSEVGSFSLKSGTKFFDIQHVNSSFTQRPNTPEQQFNILSWDGRIRFKLGKNMVLALTYK